MKKITYLFATSLLLVGCANSCMTKSDVVENHMFDIKTQYRSVDSVRYYRTQIDSLKSEIMELEDQLDFSKDLLQMKEGEISYWGHKYDSCMTILQNQKRK